MAGASTTLLGSATVAVLLAAGAAAAANIPAPSPGDCSIVAYGAHCDGKTDDSAYIQKALDDANCVIVTVPSPLECVSRALNLSLMSGRSLVIEPGAALVLWPDPQTWSLTKYNNMFLSANDGDGSWTGPLLSDFSLSGGGTIRGGGHAWWPNPNLQRPRILWVPLAKNITVSNLTLIDSPSWNMGLRGDNILVENVVVSAGSESCAGFELAPNTDGANIGGHNITVRNMRVHNGDDCVPITTGPDGSSSGIVVDSVVCECGTNGVVVYNEGQGRVESVLAQNVSVRGTNQGAGIKLARTGRNATGGLVRGITFHNYSISQPRYAALYINVFGEDSQPPCALPHNPDIPHWLTATDLMFSDLSATVAAGQSAGCFRCTPGTPCDGEFDGVRIFQPDGKPAAPFVCLNMKGSTGPHGSTPGAC